MSKRTNVFLMLLALQAGGTVLSGEPLPFQNPSGVFVISSLTTSDNVPVTTTPTNASFVVSTPGYFLFSGSGKAVNASAATAGNISFGSGGLGSPASNSGGVGLSSTDSFGDPDSIPRATVGDGTVDKSGDGGLPDGFGSAEPTVAPEPGSLWLVGIGLVLMISWKHASRARV